MKRDEAEFLQAIATRCRPEQGIPDPPYFPVREFPRDIALGLGIHPKRAAYLCDKWARKGWYDYGTSVDLGWITPRGIAVVAGGVVATR